MCFQFYTVILKCKLLSNPLSQCDFPDELQAMTQDGGSVQDMDFVCTQYFFMHFVRVVAMCIIFLSRQQSKKVPVWFFSLGLTWAPELTASHPFGFVLTCIAM